MFNPSIDALKRKKKTWPTSPGRTGRHFCLYLDETPPQFVDVGDNELLIGYDPWDEDFETKVTIPFDRNKRTTMVITGDNDSGKSIFTQFINYQLRYRMGRYIVMVDVKDDSYNMELPNTNPDFVHILRDKYHITPKGHNLKRIYPAYTKMLGVKGDPWVPALNDFKGMDSASEINFLAEFFELERGDPALNLLMAAKLQGKSPSTPAELLAKIKGIQEDGIGKKVEKLQTQIVAKQLMNQLGDRSINLQQLVHDFGMLVLKVPTVNESIGITDAFVSILISNIMAGREEYITTGKGLIDKPVTMVFEEANKYAGKRTVTNDLITQITTRFRSIRNTAGLDSILTTQHASYLEDEQVLEAEHVFGVKLTMQEDIDLLRPRARDNLSDMERLPFEMDVHPKIWWHLDKSGRVTYFKPLPTPNSMPSQTKISS